MGHSPEMFGPQVENFLDYGRVTVLHAGLNMPTVVALLQVYRFGVLKKNLTEMKVNVAVDLQETINKLLVAAGVDQSNANSFLQSIRVFNSEVLLQDDKDFFNPPTDAK